MFGFPPVDRTEAVTFSKNFLQSVIRQVKFEPNDLTITYRDEITRLLRDILPRFSSVGPSQFDVDTKSAVPVLRGQQGASSGYNLKSVDGQKVLTITKDAITYSVGGMAYTRYEDFTIDTDAIDNILSLCGINQVTRVGLRKVNLILFSYEGIEDSESIDIASFLLNPYLSVDYNSFPNKQFIHQSVQTVKYVDKNNTLNLKYGMIVPELGDANGQYVIDIDMFRQQITQVVDLKEILRLTNEEIFNVFNWVISDNAKNTLKKP